MGAACCDDADGARPCAASSVVANVASSAAAPRKVVTYGWHCASGLSVGAVTPGRAKKGSRMIETSGTVESTWKARPSAPTASFGLRKRSGAVEALPSTTCVGSRSE